MSNKRFVKLLIDATEYRRTNKNLKLINHKYIDVIDIIIGDYKKEMLKNEHFLTFEKDKNKLIVYLDLLFEEQLSDDPSYILLKKYEKQKELRNKKIKNLICPQKYTTE